MDQEQLKIALQRYYSQTASAKEEADLMQFVAVQSNEATVTQAMEELWQGHEPGAVHGHTYEALEQQILEKIIGNEKQLPGSIPRLVIFRRLITAAAIMLALGFGVYYLNNQSNKSQKSNESQFRQETLATITPGTNKAIWTLTDGKKIELDSTVLDMTSKKKQSNEYGYNELSTPRGGQYQLILPDGSKVWLNAASSIKYPVVFDGKERRVDVKGEAYFEITKDAARPFKVYGGNQEIEVLGTSFNINIYNDEPIQKTTLISGSIKITNNNQTAILKPGQQAQIINYSLLITNSSSDVLAWQSGLFNFNKVPLDQALRQLSKWYDFEVVYEKQIPSIILGGKMKRNLSFPEVLEFLEAMGVHYRLKENRQLIILP